MRKRILTLLLCTTFTLSCLSGCGSRKPEEVSESEPTQASSETSYKTMKSPDYGWTMEELLSVTYLCGRQLTCPLTVDALGEDFTVDDDITKLKDYFVTSMNYKGQYLAPCIFSAENNTEQELNVFLSLAVDMPENTDGFSFSINGAGFESSKEEVQRVLGLPDDQSGASTISYYDRVDKNRKLSITFNNDKPIEFSFYFGKDK